MSHKKSKKILLAGFVLALVVVSGIVYAVTRDRDAVNRQPVPKATIQQLPDTSGTRTTEKTNQPTGQNNQGTGTDTNGTATTNNSSNQWNQSNSGLVTVKQPYSKQVVRSGFTVSGTSEITKLQFRLIDNDSCVISQGFITPQDEKFSAVISFQARGANGRLDVFSTSSDGVETDEVQIPLRFQ